MTGALVQKMIPGGVEVVVGATLDPTSVLCAYGAGGVLVELLNVSRFNSPLTDVDAARCSMG
jgi:acyl-CoA synthetase (NDP forming)